MTKGIKLKKVCEKVFNFISSGCIVLNKVLGGGWVLGRISNIIGDESSGKTLLAIEACANFARQYPDGEIYYHEVESAFDVEYAESLGLPTNRVIFIDDEWAKKEKLDLDVFTIDGLFTALNYVIKRNFKKPKLYILDSLDALEDSTESRDEFVGEAGYSGARKAASMSSLFRKLTSKVKTSNAHFMVISQTRMKIGVTFGKKKTRSGGKALDFYASQILWLSRLKRLKKKIHNIDREYGVHILAKCEKNKIGLPFREAKIDILYRYGMDDIKASWDYLKEEKCLSRLKFEGVDYGSLKRTFGKCFDIENGEDNVKALHSVVEEVWDEIETELLPKKGKYK